MDKIIKYKNRYYMIFNYGEISYKRIGNKKNPACPYYIMDQLRSEETYIQEKFIDDYINDRYGLTTEEYYNLVVNGDPLKINVCPNCGKPLEFKGLRFQGHGGYRFYCDSKCQGEYYVKNKISNFQIRRDLNEKVCSERMKSLNKFMVDNNIHPLQKGENIISGARSKYRNNAKRYNWTHAYFYLAFYNGDYSKFKIGITQSLKSRMVTSQSFSKVGYSTIHSVVYGSVDYITDLEYKVKKEFMEFSLDSYEVFPYYKLKDVLNFIRSNR